MNSNLMKRNVGYAAAEWVQKGMTIGIGTGSTAHFFIERLIKRCEQGLQIRAICSSSASYKESQKHQIPLIRDEEVTSIDMTFDGADEIDSQKRMIKGGGGALTREKILANASRKMVVMIDNTKQVSALGRRKLPVEILPFAHMITVSKIKTLGFRGKLRTDPSANMLFYTDNGNLIYDIEFQQLRETPEKDHEQLIHIPGVIETGYFFNLAGPVLIGTPDGKVKVWE
jgi:ribose 5-phosphate isomerase A